MIALLILLLLLIQSGELLAEIPSTVRIATYNTSLYRHQDDRLIRDLEGGNNEQARKIAEVIQRVRPDVLLVNEFDYDAEGKALELFKTLYLAKGQNGQEPIAYEHNFIGPVNTGVPTVFDMDQDGETGGPADAIGFGRHPGQYGMVVLSKYPIDTEKVRTFQKFLWKDMPEAMLPKWPSGGESYYNEQQLDVLSLSSKSFWDVPVQIGDRAVHLLCSHPTPPVFDGPEDRNGTRNHDEIRMIADYISDGAYLTDDEGGQGGMPQEASFVIAGDLNADPIDGDSRERAIHQLLKLSRVNNSTVPSSLGGTAASSENSNHQGDPAQDTTFFGEGANSLRLDYVLPSKDLEIKDTGIFWPKSDEPGSEAVTATDHRLVWIDIAL